MILTANYNQTPDLVGISRSKRKQFRTIFTTNFLGRRSPEGADPAVRPLSAARWPQVCPGGLIATACNAARPAGDGLGGTSLPLDVGGRQLIARHFPMPGEKLVEPRGRTIGDAAQHLGKPSLRVDVIELDRGDQGVNRSAALATTIRRVLIMPGIWGAKLRSAIHFTRCSGGRRSWLPTSFTTAVGI